MSLLYQVDSSVIETMFSDMSKTAQITNGGGVAAWAGPNGSITTDALQSTAGNRPTYRSNYSSSGYPAIEFDGANDCLSVAHSSGWNVSILDVFLVLTPSSSAGDRGILTKFSNNAWSDAWGIVFSASRFYAGAPAYTSITATPTSGSRMLIHVHFENAKNCGQFGVHYGGSATGSGPANNSAAVNIGRADPSGYFFVGGMNEIRVYAGGETEQSIVDVKQAMRSKWGLPSVAVGSSRPSSTFLSQVIG